MAVGDAHDDRWRTCVYGLSHSSTNTILFPKPPTTFLTCFSRSKRRKYAGKKFRLSRVSKLPGHKSNMLTTEPPGRCICSVRQCSAYEEQNRVTNEKKTYLDISRCSSFLNAIRTISCLLYERGGQCNYSSKSVEQYQSAHSCISILLCTHQFLSTRLHLLTIWICFFRRKQFNPFPNKPLFLCVCSTRLLKTLWEKEKLFVTSNFSFSHRVFYPFLELTPIFIKFKIVLCKLFGSVENVSFGKGLNSTRLG